MEEKFIKEFESFNEFLNELKFKLKQSTNNYTQAEIEVLQFLSNSKDVTAKKIEEALNIDRGFLSRTLKSLQGKRLINRTQSKKDKRIYILKISTKGKKALEELYTLKLEKYDEVFNHLSEEEKHTFIESLNNVKHVFNREIQSTIHLEDDDSIDYVFNEKNAVWQAVNNKKVVTVLLYKRVNEWKVKLEFVPEVLDVEIFKVLINKAVQYAYDSFDSHLILYLESNNDDFICIVEELDFIETEKVDNRLRFDLFL